MIISQLSDYLNNLNTTEIENAHFVLEIPRSCNQYDALSHISFLFYLKNLGKPMINKLGPFVSTISLCETQILQ